MAKIAIVGAGRVGTAAAKILLTLTDHEIIFIDNSENALDIALSACVNLERSSVRVAMSPDVAVTLYRADGFDELAATIRDIDPDLVMCTTPFHINIDVATICADLTIHYIDYTEDERVTQAIEELAVTDCTFVPQTGLAPGLVNYIGLSLFESLDEPLSLELRVGALPQVSAGPEHYAITWSPEGLVNEFVRDGTRKIDGNKLMIQPFQDVRSFIVNGVTYEEVTTSGGIGIMSAYDHVPSVQYKTLRYPGHTTFFKNLIRDLSFEEAVVKTKETFLRTRDDVVVLAATAVDVNRGSASAGIHFYPCEDLDLTALELTTAGIGVAVAELLLGGKLSTGILNASNIPFDDLMQTDACRFVFEYMN